MSSAVTAGDTLVILTTTFGSKALTVSGDTGTVTSVVAQQQNVQFTSWYSSIQVVCSASGGETAIGNSYTGAIDHSSVIVMEFSGVPSSSCVDVSDTTANANSTSAVSNSITPTANNEMVVGVFVVLNASNVPTLTAGTNVAWTLPSATSLPSPTGNKAAGAMEYFGQTTASALTANLSISPNSEYQAMVVALK